LAEGVTIGIQELVREIFLANDAQILNERIPLGHVHLFLYVPRHVSDNKLIQYARGSSEKGLMEFPHFKQEEILRRTLLGRRYSVARSGNVTDQVIMEHIDSREKEP